MKKQTAVEWFFDKMKSHFEHDGDLFETVCMTYAISKAMEKEQINKACYDGYYKEDEKYTYEYYNQTYGGDQ
jgi:hypothetical protein